MIEIKGYRAAMMQLELDSALHLLSVFSQKTPNRNLPRHHIDEHIADLERMIHRLTSEIAEATILEGSIDA
jgi:N-acyl-D-aspartate/D-glutamate deacylase